MKKPRILITTRISAAGDFYLRREYSEAVENFGGLPAYLPLIPKKEFLADRLAQVEGVLLPGSDSDVDPLRFGEEPKPKLGRVQPLRDAVDLSVLEIAEELQLPVLGICYGMQALNVWRGGTLIQDIESEIPNALAHHQGEPRDRLSHRVLLEQETLLRRLSENDKVLVNSHHHQSLARIGENLKICARSSDGVIEAVEDSRPNRFVLGVQWHPELNWMNDGFSRNICAAVITAASGR